MLQSEFTDQTGILCTDVTFSIANALYTENDNYRTNKDFCEALTRRPTLLLDFLNKVVHEYEERLVKANKMTLNTHLEWSAECHRLNKDNRELNEKLQQINRIINE